MRKTLSIAGGLIVTVLVILMVAVLAFAAALSSILNSTNTIITAQTLGDDCIAPGVVSVGAVNTDKRFFTADENAARIYAQAHGLGLGDIGALTGIAVALQESSLNNGGVGDSFGTAQVAARYGGQVGDMTQSRGMFQQTAAWVEQGRAWSGMRWSAQDSRRVFSAFNPISGEPDPWNPWTGVGCQ